MGYVTKTTTETVGNICYTQSVHFEMYEDFVKDGGDKPKIIWNSSMTKPTIELTEQQAYKLRILLGHVLGDKDCADLNEQLDCLYDNELECEDYDKLCFTFIINDLPVVLEDGEKEVTIQFK